MYLGVFNDQGLFTLPPTANEIYQGQQDPTELFKRMALKILGEMYVRRLPISNKFKELLGPAYASEESESEEESWQESSSAHESSQADESSSEEEEA